MPKSRTESVDEWVEILVNLVDAGKIHLSPGDDIRREAWRLAQQDDELTHLRALAAPKRGRLDPDVIKRMIQEAEGIRSAEVAVPETEEDLREAIQAFGRASAASAIVEALTPLYEQAKGEEPD